MNSALDRLTVITQADNGVPSEGTLDALWLRLRQEAREAYAHAPMLAPLFVDSIMNQPSLEAAAFHRIAARLKNDVVGLGIIVDAFNRAMADNPALVEDLRTDMSAVVERDPACVRFIEPFLYFKGFHAIQTHRLAHWLWHNDERDFALYLQSRSSDVFQTDIHPAARFGRGVFLDHATGLVVGETAVVEDDVCLLQDVTLGGTGKESGDRHPKIRKGVLIGAGAKILGNIEVGAGARIAAGSVVLRPVAPATTVAGVPAKVIGQAPRSSSPDGEILNDLLMESFTYCI
ncbi:serine O-acetyltransferase [Pararhodospirillum oryzae]|uniref:serine O-acetyltransferase n=1 Tax=Pararhodospirillum oryzae TaxID=478448 RepID=UPI0011BDBDE8|nr:serine O-acetyltransferase [Pararhodospirillum oryzae]